MEPLYDQQSEWSTIGSCFFGGYPTFYEVKEILDVNDFYEEKIRMIFEVIIDLHKKNQPITDVTSIHAALNNKITFKELIEISNSVTTYKNARHYAEIVKSKSIARQKINQCRDIIQKLFEGEDPREIISKGMQNDIQILNKGQKSEAVHIKDTYMDFLNELEMRRETKGLVGISTGFSELDYILRGLKSGGMYIIGARPKMGKTTLAVNIAKYVAFKLKIPVYFKSLEMTITQLDEKIANDLSDVDGYRIQNASLLSDSEYKKVKDVGENIYESALYIDDKSSTASSFATTLRRWKISHGIGLVIIDYLQRFKSEPNIRGKYEQVSEISNIICDVAKEINTPILALSQLSRDVEKRDDKVPMASDLRESGSLEQDAAAVMLMYRDDYYYPDKYPPNNDPSEVEIYIPLNRFGPSGKVNLMFNKAKSRFTQIEKYRKYEKAS